MIPVPDSCTFGQIWFLKRSARTASKSSLLKFPGCNFVYFSQYWAAGALLVLFPILASTHGLALEGSVTGSLTMLFFILIRTGLPGGWARKPLIVRQRGTERFWEHGKTHIKRKLGSTVSQKIVDLFKNSWESQHIFWQMFAPLQPFANWFLPMFINSWES